MQDSSYHLIQDNLTFARFWQMNTMPFHLSWAIGQKLSLSGPGFLCTGFYSSPCRIWVSLPMAKLSFGYPCMFPPISDNPGLANLSHLAELRSSHSVSSSSWPSLLALAVLGLRKLASNTGPILVHLQILLTVSRTRLSLLERSMLEQKCNPQAQ